MKRTLLTIACFISFLFSANAQSLYGTTFNGGDNGAGTLYHFEATANQLTIVKSFESFASDPAYTNLIKASDGKLYGLTQKGGNYNLGTLFSFDQTTGTNIVLHSFDSVNGVTPTGSLLEVNGKLYGLTQYGGVNNVGTVFSFDPAASAFQKLADFNITNGRYPYGSMIKASNGKLYGLTSGGGADGIGNVFSFDIASSAISLVASFNRFNGSYSYGDLTEGKDGKLYGVTAGITNPGNIFSFDTTTNTLTDIFDFDGANGSYPSGTLLLASNGKFYGTANQGGVNNLGVIFSFDPVTKSYIKIKDLDEQSGDMPLQNLTEGPNGILYGLTVGGGANDKGVIYSLDTASLLYTRLFDFKDSTGSSPYGSLVRLDNGKLYGMTSSGGQSGDGVIFYYDIINSSFVKAGDLGTNEDGSNPGTNLIRGNDSRLYGLTVNGGKNGAGVIFSYDPSSLQYEKLKDLDLINGAHPYGGLLLANDGKMYGLTSAGGSADSGTIFSYDPSSGIYTKLKDFNLIDGAYPKGSLIQATDGLLYGLTFDGGISEVDGNSYGIMFSYDPVNKIYAKLFDFTGYDGGNPSGNVVQTNNGKLYGLTPYVVSHFAQYQGSIFSWDPSSLSFDLPYYFQYNMDNNAAPGGTVPQGSFTKVGNKLYGTTSGNTYGGSSNNGGVFSYDPLANNLQKLYDFDGTNGASPQGTLLLAEDGKLYGNTVFGGSNNSGVVFSIDSLGNYTKLIDYDGVNGFSPSIGSLFIEVPEGGPLPVRLLSFTGKNNRDNNHLQWKVSNEVSLAYYELERSGNGTDFNDIAKIVSSSASDYTYNDKIDARSSSIYFYRLKMVDKDSRFTYSNIITLRNDANANFITVNPNPFKNEIIVTLQSDIQNAAFFILNDLAGRQLLAIRKNIVSGLNIISLGETTTLPKGTYFLTVITQQKHRTIKVIKGE